MSFLPTTLAGPFRWVRTPFGGLIVGATLTVSLLLTASAVFDWGGGAAPPPAQSGRAELVIYSGVDESTGGQRQKLIEEWNERHRDTPARLVSLPTSADAQHSEMRATAQSDAPDADVYNLDTTWTASFASAGFILPLTVTDTAGFLDAPLATCRFDGKLWALPFNTDAGLLYYRTGVPEDALPTALPPGPNDVRVLAGLLPRIEAGFVTPLSGYEGLTVSALEAIWAEGGDVYDAAQDLVVIDSEPARAGLRKLAQAMKRNGDVPPAVHPQSTTFREDTSREAFRAGKVALMRNWPVAYGQLRAGDQPLKDFGVRALPGPSVLGGQNLAIASSTDNPRAAQELIEFLTSEESERRLFRDGGLAATRTGVYSDPQVLRNRPYAPTLLQALGSARPRPESTHYALFSSTFQEIVTQTLNSDGNLPADAVSRLTDALHGRLS
ncbi:extracellular solute-binding protein [Actinoplanes utahensis]|uniref:extracellular solute-binding protein n=1 Tax=Actinoplanes utahensis TaxID=1869 RepID=UPI00068A34D9|nr:extracellular solute-binding protein [Actinoplanes utahensis]GIF31655.1 sugar ABC transporter substrate-binding protein [Actinoplanes utahensis]